MADSVRLSVCNVMYHEGLNSTEIVIPLRHTGETKVYCSEYSHPLPARPYGKAGCKQVIAFRSEQGSGDGKWAVRSMEQRNEIQHLEMGFLFGGQHYEYIFYHIGRVFL